MKLITKTLIIATFLFSSAALNSQEMTYGVQSGLVFTEVFSTDSPSDYFTDFDLVTTYSINGYIGYRGNSFFGVSLEPGYIKKGDNKRPMFKYRYWLISFYSKEYIFLSGLNFRCYTGHSLLIQNPLNCPGS